MKTEMPFKECDMKIDYLTLGMPLLQGSYAQFGEAANGAVFGAVRSSG